MDQQIDQNRSTAKLFSLSEPGRGRVAARRAFDAALVLRQELLLLPEHCQHGSQAFMANDHSLMCMGEFIELPVLEISAFIADFDPPVRIVDDGYTLAGQLLVLTTGVDEIQDFVVLKSQRRR